MVDWCTLSDDRARGVCSSAVGQRGSGNRNIAPTRCHLWKRDGSHGRAEAADRHHRSVLKRVLPVPIPAPLVPPTSPEQGLGPFIQKHFSKEVSASSWVRALTRCCRSAGVELAGRAAVGTLLRLRGPSRANFGLPHCERVFGRPPLGPRVRQLPPTTQR